VILLPLEAVPSTHSHRASTASCPPPCPFPPLNLDLGSRCEGFASPSGLK
jgi:hypothetical protein